MENLNPSQKKAVLATDGRVLVLAGAGSGKTKVLTHRIAYLISEKNVAPSKILGLTFTNKAAEEMRRRVSGLIGQKKAKEVTLSTFHSFCLKVLREDIQRLGFTDNFSIYDENDIERMVGGIVRDLLGREKELPSLQPTIALIAKARSQGGFLLGDESTVNWHDTFSKEVFQRLESAMRAYNAIDFDSMLFFTKRLFEDHQDVLAKWQERYSHVMIDEYQDTSPVQYQITELLTKKSKNLCVVGDDDQSIYGWRGASLKNILEFDHTHRITLDQNYRSTNSILRSANTLIAQNSLRHAKNLWSSYGDGDPIEVFVAPNEAGEAEAIAHRIIALKDKMGIGFSDIAVLYRSNALSRQIEKAFLKHSYVTHQGVKRGIPYQIVGGTEFYERREVKDVLGYLRSIVNEKDTEALIRIINYPRRGIGDEALDTLTAYSRKEKIALIDVLRAAHELPIKISKQAVNGIQEFLAIHEESKQRFLNDPLPLAMNFLVDRIKLKSAIENESRTQKGQDFKWDNVQEFLNSVKEVEQEGEGSSYRKLSQFVSDLTLRNERHFNDGEGRQDAVQLMTFHSSKGLEFKVCFLIGIEDHIVPHEKSIKDVGIEEERRLLYVAITRAMRYLTISMAKERSRMGQPALSRPSRFLFEIPKELIKTTKWDEIS